MIDELRAQIEQAPGELTASDRARLGPLVEDAMSRLDRRELRVAELREGDWVVNEWVKRAILLYFRLRAMVTVEIGPFEFHDKIPLKRNFAAAQVRVVPPGICRYGAHLEPGVV